MSEVTWRLNGATLDSLKLTVAGGTFKTQGVSFALLDAAADFDAGDVIAYGASATLTRTEGGVTVKIFQGKVAPVSRLANPEYEGHKYPLEDAWAELEATTYQESWRVGVGAFMIPRSILGLDDTGKALTVGGQIEAVISYAASVGVALQMGSAPAGEELWPKEVTNISCAEAINQCLEFHPDWVPWIDHATTPPTFNVTARADMVSVNLPTSGTGNVVSFSETERLDLVPDGVRIVYEFATSIEDEVYRNVVVDQWPVGSPDGGPKVLCTTIPLAGGQMQIQKSRVRVRPMPESGEKGTDTKKWLKANFPRLADVDIGDFTVLEFSKTLAVDDTADNPHPPEISKQALRLVPDDADDVPNQLVDGQIEDWMRKMVGWVNFTVKIEPASGASAAVKKKLTAAFPPGRVRCTNAVSKTYKGVTQWVAADAVPVGIATGVYNSMVAAYLSEGEVTLGGADLSATRYHGKRVTLAGAKTAGAMIHSVSWDIGSGETRIGFGPVPELAPADFLELQRRLRSRNVTWWSKDERADNKLGAEKDPSAAGDTVTGYYQPGFVLDAGDGAAGGAAGPFSLSVSKEGTGWKFKVSSIGSSITEKTNGEMMEVSGLDELTTISTDKYIVLEASVDESLEVSGWSVKAVDEADALEVKMGSGDPPEQEKLRVLVGKITISGDPENATATQALFTSVRVAKGIVEGSVCAVWEAASTHPAAL